MEARWIRGNLIIAPGKIETNQRVLEWLQSSLSLPENYARKLLHEKRVYSGDKTIGVTDEMPTRGKVLIQGHRERNGGNEQDGPDRNREWTLSHEPVVLFEDEHLMVLDKPAGWLIHSDGNEVWPVLSDWVNHQLSERGQGEQAFHVHRLDRDTTGCVLYAKHEFMARALDSMMLNRLIHRTYVALVHGRMKAKQGRIDLSIGRDRHISGKYRVSGTGKPAVTLYRELAYTKPSHVSVVECVLLTGRTHQIRVHFAASGCPLVGDRLYALEVSGGVGEQGRVGPRGDLTPSSRDGQALHARRLDWVHPYTGESLTVQAPYPTAFVADLKRYGINPEVIA